MRLKCTPCSTQSLWRSLPSLPAEHCWEGVNLHRNGVSGSLETAGPSLQALPQDFGTVVVVLHRVLNKTESVDVTHIRVAVGTEQVKAAHGLLRTT